MTASCLLIGKSVFIPFYVYLLHDCMSHADLEISA